MSRRLLNKNIHSRKNFALLILALLPFISIPLIGSQFYFRHDDSALLLWAKEFAKPFYQALSADPAVNGFANYPGMAPYWRPFDYLYIKALWYLFGTSPAPYYIVGGLTFLAAVYFLFRLVQEQISVPAAVLSCFLLFIAFNGTMYNLFHIGVPVSFFYQMGMIYCFWAYLQQPRWIYLTGMLLFLLPAMGRQTTSVILAAMLIVAIFDRRKELKIFLRKSLPATAILFVSIYILKFSPQTSKGSVIALLPDLDKVLIFLSERFFYYGTILTSGITGSFMLLFFSAGVLHHLAEAIKKRFAPGRIEWLWLPAALFMTFALMRIYPYGIYWLAFCVLYLFVFDDELRMSLGWAGASLLCFLAAKYYHNGYLLEAGFPLAIALGILAVRLAKPFTIVWRQYVEAHKTKLALTAAGAVLLAIPFVFAFTDKVPVLSERVEIIKMAIDSNKNFASLMNYLQHELPQNAVVYELSEEAVGTTQT
ncbi:MAG: hypothetical protein ACE5I1_28205, partial [bacterium]